METTCLAPINCTQFRKRSTNRGGFVLAEADYTRLAAAVLDTQKKANQRKPVSPY